MSSPLAFGIITIVLVVWCFHSRRRRNIHLPPGPPPRFLVGNALQLQLSHSWLYYAEVSKQYGAPFILESAGSMAQVTDARIEQGDVVYFDVFGQPIIALNSLRAVEDLVVKKSAIFSGRPHLTMCQDLSVCVFVLRNA
jgi:hypothetical protein